MALMYSRRLARLSGAGVLLLLGAVCAHANGFIGPYAPGAFTLINSGGLTPNGFADFPDFNTLVLTGSNDGNGELGGTTDLVTAALGTGIFQFDWTFFTTDDPGYEFAGYLVGTNFTQFSDTNGDSGSVSTLVTAGELFGFRVGTVDNTGGPGVLTVTDFSGPAPVPEPGTFLYLLAAAVVLAAWRGRARVWLPAALLALALPGPAPAQQVYYSGTNVTGALSLVRTVNLQQQAQVLHAALLLKASTSEQLKAPVPYLHPPVTTVAGPTPHARAALHESLKAATPALTGLSVVQAGWGFNALSHYDERNANNGNQFSIEPPNPNIAVGNGYVLEGVNDAVQVYSTAGAPQFPTVLASNQVFGLAPAINRTTGVHGVYLTDMRVYYDPGMNRWMVLQRSQDNDAAGNNLDSSHLYLAVSQTGDPTGTYNIYVMDTTNANHPGCGCIADYPQVGSDQFGFHIAWNEYNYNVVYQSYQFIDATILSLSKAALAAGTSAPAAVQFFVPLVTGYEFAIQPATTPPGASNFIGSGGLEYFASTMSSLSSGDEVALWAVYNTSSLATPSPSPILISIVVPTEAYAFPDVANQENGPIPYGASLGQTLEYLDGGDPRVQSLTYAGGRLYMTFQTGVNDANGRWVVGGAYIVLSPTYRGSTLAAQVLSQGYLLVNSNHLLRPYLAVNAQGTGAFAVTLVGPNWYPSAAVIPYKALTAPAAIDVAGVGALPEDGFSGYPPYNSGLARWGDYNTAVIASDGSVWLVAEYIGNYPRTQFANWNTFIMH